MHRAKRIPVLIGFVGILALGLGIYLQLSGRLSKHEGAAKIPLSVSADVAEVQAYINGTGPYSLPHSEKVAPGSYEIEAMAEGYMPTVKTVTVAGSDTQASVAFEMEPLSVGISFIRLRTQTPARGVFGTATEAFYAIGDEIRGARTHELKMRFPGQITGVFPLPGGKAGISYKGGAALYSPPFTSTALPAGATIIGAGSTGEAVYVYLNGSVGIASGSKATILFAVPAGFVPVKAVGDPSKSTVFLSGTEGNGSAVYWTQGNAKPARLKSYQSPPPAIAYNAQASLVAVSDGNAHTVYSTKGQQRVSVPNAWKSPSPVAPYMEGFIVFEKDTLNEQQTITRAYYLSTGAKNKTLLTTDAPVPDRMSFDFTPFPIDATTFGTIDTKGNVWILGDITRLPKSLFSTSPQIPYKAPAP